MSFSRGSSQCRNQTQVSCIAGRFYFTSEPPETPKRNYIYHQILSPGRHPSTLITYWRDELRKGWNRVFVYTSGTFWARVGSQLRHGVWYKYTMEYYSAIKNETMPFAATWMDLEVIIPEWSKSDRKRQISYHLNAEYKRMIQWTYLQNKSRLTDIKNKLMIIKGERWGRVDKLGVWE